jgi:spermidine synthase
MDRARRRRRGAAAGPTIRPLDVGLRRCIVVLFVLSGVSGLIYQVVWARQLTLVFGATSPAITTVLASFMLGLALGSQAAGRLARRWGDPVRAYGVIELGIAAYAIAFPGLLHLLTLVHVPLFRLLVEAPVALGVVRIVIVAVLLLPPTALMGASLPVLARALVRDPTGLGRDAGILYGVNTLGAAAGVYLGAFFLIPGVGLTGAWLTAAALNAAVGVVALAGARRWPWRGGEGDHVPAVADSPPRWPVLIAFGCSGLAALGYEVVWTRLLILLFGSSVYAFAVMLSGFLLGLGLGGLLGGWLVARRPASLLLAASLQVIITVGVLAAAPWFDGLPRLFLEAFRVTGGVWWSLTGLQYLMAVGLMIVPTLAMGAAFPVVARLLGPAPGAERAVGDAYAVNTWGAIAGAALTGFVLIPWLGFRGSLVALAGVNTLAACLLLAGASPRGAWHRWALPVPAVALIVAVSVLPAWSAKALSSGVYVYADRYSTYGFERLLEPQRVLFYREGATATVAVMEGRYRFLRINGKTDAGDSPDNLTQRLLAHVPLLLHPDPRSVLVVGLGTGMTLGTALLYPIEHADVVEIAPEVVEASQFFTEASGRPLDDARARLRVLDARTWLMAGLARYDVIISEPSNPWQTGNANLFTLEHYRLTRSRLTPGGVFCQWLPFYRMDEADFRAAIRTFHTVFADVTVWFSGGDVLLVGSTTSRGLDPERFLARTADGTIARSLRGIGIPDGAGLLGFFLLDAERVREYVGSGPLHSDTYPLLEFSAPKTLYRESAPQILATLRRLAGTSALPLAPGDGRQLATLYEGIARQNLALKMPEAALRALERAHAVGGATPAVRRLQGLAWNEIGAARVHAADIPGASAAFEQALLLAPGEPEVHLNVGLVAFKGLADLPRAERHLREALRLRPGDVQALSPLAEMLARQGRWDEAEAAWRQVLWRRPDDSDAQHGLAAAARARRLRGG